jgi:hypothetical protein
MYSIKKRYFYVLQKYSITLKLITVTRASGLSNVERGINDGLICRRTEHFASGI